MLEKVGDNDAAEMSVNIDSPARREEVVGEVEKGLMDVDGDMVMEIEKSKE